MVDTTARRICVTGATGKAGRAAVSELREHGYQVVATDARVTGDDVRAGVLRADLTDYGEATEALRGVDAVVHLANIPAPGLSTPAVTFNDNVTMNFNVFHAAAALGLARVVWASSETTLGLPFGGGPSRSLARRASRPLRAGRRGPLPGPDDDLRAVQGGQRDDRGADLRLVADSVRRAAHLQHHGAPRLRALPVVLAGTAAAQVEPVGYVDVRDVAAACRLGLEADVTGSQSVIIAAADTVMNRPSREMLAEVFLDARSAARSASSTPAGDRPGQAGARLPAPLLLARRDSR